MYRNTRTNNRCAVILYIVYRFRSYCGHWMTQVNANVLWLKLRIISHLNFSYFVQTRVPPFQRNWCFSTVFGCSPTYALVNPKVKIQFLWHACLDASENACPYCVSSGPGSSVGIATGYGLDGPGIESRWRRDFPHRPWGPPSLLYSEYRVFPGGKELQRHDADPSPPSSAVVKEE